MPCFFGSSSSMLRLGSPGFESNKLHCFPNFFCSLYFLRYFEFLSERGRIFMICNNHCHLVLFRGLLVRNQNTFWTFWSQTKLRFLILFWGWQKGLFQTGLLLLGNFARVLIWSERIHFCWSNRIFSRFDRQKRLVLRLGRCLLFSWENYINLGKLCQG